MERLINQAGLDLVEQWEGLFLAAYRDIAGAANQLLRWDKAHVDGELVVVQGLINRRRAERMLFLGTPVKALATELLEYYQGRKRK